MMEVVKLVAATQQPGVPVVVEHQELVVKAVSAEMVNY